MKLIRTILNLAFVAAFVGCEGKVDLGGESASDDSAATGGESGAETGGTAQSSGGVSGLAGNSSGGTSGDLGGNAGATAGGASTATGSADAGVGGSFGGAGADGAGSGSGGATSATGGGGMMPELPDCLQDLYALCPPEGACRDDGATNTTCFDSGVYVVEESSGECTPDQGFTTRRTYYRASGQLCFTWTHVRAFNTDRYCEQARVTWEDASGALVATGASENFPYFSAWCIGGARFACGRNACQWIANGCVGGVCPF